VAQEERSLLCCGEGALAVPSEGEGRERTESIWAQLIRRLRAKREWVNPMSAPSRGRERRDGTINGRKNLASPYADPEEKRPFRGFTAGKILAA